MKKYIVYCHTLNGKKYIGYTGKTMEERLQDHISEALDGSDRHFHRAINKYGSENIVSEVLAEVYNKDEAKRLEETFVEKLDTFKNGYNMTRGGDGGNTTEKYSEEKMKDLSNRRSLLQKGMNNSRAKPNITKDMIVDAVVQFCIENNKQGEYLLRKEIESVLKEQLGVSQMILKNRIDRGLKQLIEEVNTKLSVPVKYDPYYRGEEHKNKLSSATSSHRWVTNGIDNVKLTEDTLEKFLAENPTYKQGRTLKNGEDRKEIKSKLGYSRIGLGNI
jgi:group I intron endonuclease